MPLTGGFNVENALLAAAVATALGIDEDTVAEGLAAAGPVPGRMEVVARGGPSRSSSTTPTPRPASRPR